MVYCKVYFHRLFIASHNSLYSTELYPGTATTIGRRIKISTLRKFKIFIKKTILKGYELGKYMYFMVELSIQDLLQGLSQIIKLMIK